MSNIGCQLSARPAPRPVELGGSESAVPAEDSVRLGHTGNLCKGFASDSLADLGQSRPLRIRQTEASRQVPTEDYAWGKF